MAKKKRKKRRIRPLALCVFFRDDKIFLARGYDSVEDTHFYRPIGGRIEFGERGCETVAREVKEEIDADVIDVTYLGALENIFRYEGKAGHEIVLVYQGKFANAEMNRDDAIARGLDGGDVLYEGSWQKLETFRGKAAPPLYPAGLPQLLERAGRLRR